MRAAAAIFLAFALACPFDSRAESLPRSVVILDQSAPLTPWSTAIQSSLQLMLKNAPGNPIAIYSENLDFGLFRGEQYDADLRAFLASKYRNVNIGVIIALGARSLEFAIQSRAKFWSKVPIVFAGVDEAAAATVNAAPNVTGAIMKLPLADLILAARIIQPNFARLVIVGDPFDRQPFRGHFREEMNALKDETHFVDLTGQPLTELKKLVATLQSDTVIAYTNIYSDGKGVVYTPRDALAALAEVANRPIAIDVETFLGPGSVGGFLARPEPVGHEAARTAIRILDGEAAAAIPVSEGEFKKPIFDWRQLQRWQIAETQLPAGSEIRFRPPTAWEQYHSQIVVIAIALIGQSLLIVGLIYEHRHRRHAELEAQHRMSELARVNRSATAGELSASLAHEINQPLAAIVSNGNAGLRWQSHARPNLEEAAAAFGRIVRDGHRASQVIDTVRGMFKKDTQKHVSLNVNDLVREVLALLRVELQKHDVSVRLDLSDSLALVTGDRIQLQQVILNLAMNAIEAMNSVTGRSRVLTIRSQIVAHSVAILVDDSGPGIDPSALDRVFQTFFSTKAAGMGMGLSICRSIVEAHGGKVSVSNMEPCGAAFRILLPSDTQGSSASQLHS